ncbi:MAG: homoserine kinase [Bryobacterales bacterium]|nr:homoserine kinase [Bryobacterales bacterium]
MTWRLRVPASSANLGPGFDALGLALGVYLECHVEPAGKLEIKVEGRDAALISTGPDNLIWKTAETVANDRQQALPPIRLHIHNDIPLGKGLGSSAAALTAGVVIAEQLLGLNWKPNRVLDEAARLEGHPDNVAACVLGSIVASAIDSGGTVRAVRLALPERYQVAVVVPDFTLPTSHSRAVLPSGYSRQDTIHNVQRVALLMAAIATGTTSAFPVALEDRLHQPYRTALVPGLAEILRLRAPGLLGCTLSGAGPSVLVFYERGSEQVCDLVRQVFALHRREAEVVTRNVSADGYRIEKDPTHS